MNKILAILIILGLLISLGDGGRTRKAAKKVKGGNSVSRNPKAPSGPRDPNDARDSRGIKRKIFENIENLRNRAKPAKRARVEHAAAEVVETSPTASPPGDVAALEKKWMAVLEFRHLVDTGASTNDAVAAIGVKYGVGTGRNVRLLSKYVDERGSLVRKVGSGAPKTVSNRPDILEFFEEKAKSFEYIFTMELMANLIKAEFNVGSVATVKEIMDHLEYSKKSRAVRPFLTEEHKSERLKWAKEWVNYDFFDGDEVVVHIDEKNFYAFSAKGRTAYMPPGVDPKPLYALSKTQIPWVMFLGAVAAPREDKGFDGKIGLWHVGEEKEAKRRSKYHERGDVYMVNINMDGDVFMEMMTENVIPAILQKCSWAKKVIVQMDSAGGHRIGETLAALNKIGKKQSPKIEFRTQPTRSPDVNVLDLGIWNSMRSRVPEIRYDRTATESITQRIIDAVMDMWEKYDSAKLHNIFITLNAVYEEIIAHDGGNSFKQPHTIKDHL